MQIAGRLKLGLAVAAVLCIALPVFAQVQTGSVLVKAADAQGAVLPGVTVTLTSPVLVAPQVGVTDSTGVFRFLSLPPGTYAAKLELASFQTIVRENIVVSVGQTTPIDLSMKLASVQETVTVTGESPVVDTTSANVNVTLSDKLLQSTPGGRDIWSLVEYKVPGLISSRPDVGGTSGGLQGAMVARGTPNSQNAQFLNGVNVGDPAAVGYAGFYYDYGSFDEVQVSTGAQDITVPSSGVFVNMVTKSGTNQYKGRASLFWEGSSTQGRNVDSTLLGQGFKPDTNKVDFVSDVNINLGGPIIKDKLRFFASFRDWRVHVNVPAAFSESVLDQTNITSGLGNFTYQLSDNNRLTAFYARQYYKKPDRFLGSSAFYTSESNSNEDDVFDIVQGLWNSVITNKFFMDARVSYNKIFFPLYFNGNDQTLSDLSTGIRSRNAAQEYIFIRKRLQASATFNYYIDHALGGRHELRFGVDNSHMPTSTEVHRYDNVDLSYYSATGASRSVTFYNTPVQSKANLNVLALFFQDSYTIKRLSLVGGVRWERVESYLPAQSSPPSPWFPDIQRSFEPVRNAPLWHTAGPRVSAIYDVDNGKTALKFSAGRYYYMISTGTANSINPNFNSGAQYAWNDANHDLHFQDGEQTGVGVPFGGLTTSFDPNFKRPYTNEVTAGAGPRADPQPEAERRVHLPHRARPAGEPQHRLAARHVGAHDRHGPRPGRHDGHGRRRHLQLLRPDAVGQPDAHHQRPDEQSDLQGPGDHGHQALLEQVADARRLHLRPDDVEEPLGRHEPERLPEHHGPDLQRPPAAVQADGQLRPPVRHLPGREPARPERPADQPPDQRAAVVRRQRHDQRRAAGRAPPARAEDARPAAGEDVHDGRQPHVRGRPRLLQPDQREPRSGRSRRSRAA